MKCVKFIALILSAVMVVGCAKESSAELTKNAANGAFADIQNESGTAEQVALNDPSEINNDISDEEDTHAEEDDTSGTQKVFESVSYEHLSEAEQIYNSLYNWADFEQYVTFDLHEDVDYNDRVDVERILFPTAGREDEEVGTSYFEPYFRIADGRLSNGVDFAMWLDSFASQVYVVKTFREWYKERFVVSDGTIYVYYNMLDYYGGWLITSDLTLDSITSLENDANNPIQLNFSYTDYGVDIDSVSGTTEHFTVVMSQNNGWKIDSYTGGYMDVVLINEFFRSGEPSDLLTQIEDYLSENPIS